jgi:hypothetical protein
MNPWEISITQSRKYAPHARSPLAVKKIRIAGASLLRYIRGK